MRKIILYIATSLNGYIAKRDGRVDWLESIFNSTDDDYGYSKFYNSIDTTIQGNNTYRQLVEWGIEFPYKNKLNYVITNDNQASDNDDVIFNKKNHSDFIKSLKTIPGKNIWLIGGGKVNSLLLNNGLIDEIYQFLMPIVIEDGIKLFETVNNDINLKIIDTKIYDLGVIRYRYKIG